jgi:hypothetical protein
LKESISGRRVPLLFKGCESAAALFLSAATSMAAYISGQTQVLFVKRRFHRGKTFTTRKSGCRHISTQARSLILCEADQALKPCMTAES